MVKQVRFAPDVKSGKIVYVSLSMLPKPVNNIKRKTLKYVLIENYFWIKSDGAL